MQSKGSVGCWSNPLNCFNERRQSNLSCNMLYYTNANWQLQYQLLKPILQIMQIWGARKTRGAHIYIYCFLNYICHCFKCAITCHYVLFLLIIDFCGPLINVHMYIYISRYSWLALKECDPVFFTKRYHWNQRKPLFNSSLSFLAMPASINDCNFQYVQT